MATPAPQDEAHVMREEDDKKSCLEETGGGEEGESKASSIMLDSVEATLTGEQILVKFLDLQQQGRDLYKEKNFDEALRVWEQALELVAAATNTDGTSLPSILEQQKIRSNMVACLLQMEQADRAVQEARNCIAMNDTWIKGHIRLAKAHRQKCDFQEALNAIDTAILQDPENEQTKKLAADYLQDYEKALLSGKKTSRHAPTDIDQAPKQSQPVAPHNLFLQHVVMSVFHLLASTRLIGRSVAWFIWRVVVCAFLGVVLVFSVATTSNRLFDWAWRRLQRERYIQWPMALDTLRQLWVQLGGTKALAVVCLCLVITTVHRHDDDPCAVVETTNDPYRVLQVPSTATTREITKAYRKLSVKCHSDKLEENGVPAKVADARFVKINEAKEILTDSIQRPIYDDCGHYGLEILQRMQRHANNKRWMEDPARVVCGIVQDLDRVETVCGREALRMVLEEGIEPSDACHIVYMRRNHPQWNF